MRSVSPRLSVHQACVASIGMARRYVLENNREVTVGYLLLLSACLVAYLIATPVGSGDTDLWYHMNGGRLLWEFDRLPDTPFYSIFDADGDRSWVNYFWGFQALSYLAHDALGYPGLILLRLVLVGVAFAAITAIALRPEDRAAQRAWALVLVALVIMVFVGRAAQIRPHLFSYAMIPLFILILQHHRRWLPALPVLTVAWINVHGIEWPVGALICGAYALNALWEKWGPHPVAKALDWRTIGWTLACVPAMFINPFGIGILSAPFNTSSEVYAYIAELRSYAVEDLFTINMMGPLIGIKGVIALLAWGSVAAYAVLLLRGRIRLVPLLLSLAGIYLLSRGTRFAWEWLLLSLPLWRSAISAMQSSEDRRHSPTIGLTGVVLLTLLAAPLVSWANSIRHIGDWPLDSSKLPLGVTEFIVEQRIGGRMLAPESLGGYLAWHLYPDMLISGDMQTPPTLPWDHLRRMASIRNSNVLQRLIEDYQPQLIAVEAEHKTFPLLMEAHDNYRPVFFDDQLVLYADATQLSTLVAEYGLAHVNPFNLLDDKLGTLEQRLHELTGLLEIHPEGDRVQHAITRLLFDNGEYERSLEQARRFARSVPDNANSHYLLGNSLENLDRFEEAEENYLRALTVSPLDFEPVLYRHLGSCAYLRKDLGRAFDYFDKGINIYLRNEEPEYVYQFAVAAVATDHLEKARILLDYLAYSLGPEHQTLLDRAAALRVKL